jgi:hypothetical protein
MSSEKIKFLGNAKGLLILIALSVLFIFFSGCVSPPLSEIKTLKNETLSSNGFVSEEAKLTAYINSLNLVEPKYYGSARDAIKAELLLANTMYYSALISKSAQEAMSSFPTCNSKEKTNLINYLKLGYQYSNEAKIAFSKVSASDAESMGSKNGAIVSENYVKMIDEIKTWYESKCGKVRVN